MKAFLRYGVLAAATVFPFLSVPAVAKDALIVTASDGPDGFVSDASGNPLSEGTYAVGHLKIFFVVSATEWPENLSPVTLGLAVKPIDKKPTTNYPVPIRLRPIGGDLVLSPDPETLNVIDSDWEGQATISISVPESIRLEPSLNADGTMLVGNLQIENDEPRKHFDTVTTVQIRAFLSHPTGPCLKSYMFLSNQGVGTDVSEGGFEATYGMHPLNGFQGVTGTTPAQLLSNGLTVNTCGESKTFDVQMTLDGAFPLRSTGSNKVRLRSSEVNYGALVDDFDIGGFDPDDFNTNISQGNDVCVQNVVLATGHSLWTAADIEFNDASLVSEADVLNAVGTEYNGFAFDTNTPAVACGGASHPDSNTPVTTATTLTNANCQGGGCN